MSNENMHYDLFYRMFYKLWIIKNFVCRVVLLLSYIRCILNHLLSVELRDFFYATVNSATVAVGNQGFLTMDITFLKEKGKKKKKTTIISWCILDHRIKRWDYFVFLYMIKK